MNNNRESKLPEGFIETDEFRDTLQRIEETNRPVFLTGFAGTGKSTFLRYFLENASAQQPVILAPTGVAAVNVEGQTIHSFFRFPPRYLPRNRIERLKEWKFYNLRTIIIDEISMVRADMMDNIDTFLRLHMGCDDPFGGVKVIMIGDVNQLSPVVEADLESLFKKAYRSPFFFDAHVFKEAPLLNLSLTHIFRQKDPTFIRILNNIRKGVMTPQDMVDLKERVGKHIEGDVITLTTTNKDAFAINQTMINHLNTESMTYFAKVSGSFDSKYFPTDEHLLLKVGAQVMMLRNGPSYCNGTICTIVELNKDYAKVLIGDKIIDEDGFDRSHYVKVTPSDWQRIEYITDEASGEIKGNEVGTFTQLPLKLAWAITIHKSQGLTFDKVKISLGRGSFAHGQTYVALSRCRSLEGISLSRPIISRDIIFDKKSVLPKEDSDNE